MSSFLLCLTTEDNDYQQEQALAGQSTAFLLGVGLQVVYADGDPGKQAAMLMDAVTSRRFQGLVFEPVGASLAQVAERAVDAGIGWAVLNSIPDYVEPLRETGRAPVFSVSTDHLEVGRIQGMQAQALVPHGGSVLLVQGAAGSDAARERTEGFNQTKPTDATVRLLRAAWTESSALHAVQSWGEESRARIDLVVAQNDVMGVGARRALLALAVTPQERARLTRLPVLGADGLQDAGQLWVRLGTLTATTQIPANAGVALQLLVQALRGTVVSAVRKTVPHSVPPLESLRPISAA